MHGLSISFSAVLRRLVSKQILHVVMPLPGLPGVQCSVRCTVEMLGCSVSTRRMAYCEFGWVWFSGHTVYDDVLLGPVYLVHRIVRFGWSQSTWYTAYGEVWLVAVYLVHDTG